MEVAKSNPILQGGACEEGIVIMSLQTVKVCRQAFMLSFLLRRGLIWTACLRWRHGIAWCFTSLFVNANLYLRLMTLLLHV